MSLKLSVRISRASTILITCSPSDTVEQVINQVMEISELSGSPQLANLNYNGRALPKGSSLGSLGLEDGAEVFYFNPMATFSPSAQRQAAGMMKNEQRVREIMENIAENYPQLLVNSAQSIYVKYLVEDKEDVMVVDSGCEFSLMSMDTVKRLGLEGDVDYRYRGAAVGVGRGTLIGMLHFVPVRLTNQVLPMNFHVMQEPCITLLGMNVLRMYRAVIDLDKMSVTLDGCVLEMLTGEEAEEAHKIFVHGKTEGDGAAREE